MYKAEFWSTLSNLTFQTEGDVEHRLVLPLLAHLGWSSAEVHAKVRIKIAAGHERLFKEADFLVAPSHPSPPTEAYIVVEAKRPRKSLAEAAIQAESYAREVFASTFVITDGQELEIWHRHGITSAQKVFSAPVAALGHHHTALDLLLGRPAVLDFHARLTARALPVPDAGHTQRGQYLLGLHQESAARCVTRWTALGVAVDEAEGFLADPTVGAVPEAARPTADQRLKILVGEWGSGKSLVGERLLQEAIAAAQHDVAAPLPVFLEAQDVGSRLSLPSLGLPDAELLDRHDLRVLLIIDGADEVGVQAASRLVQNVRTFARRWPKSQVLLTCRPLPALDPPHCPERVDLHPWSDEEAQAWIARLSGPSLWLLDRQAALADALRRPLFATLYAVARRGTPEAVPASQGELFDSLVNRALGANRGSAPYRLLRRLAVALIQKDLPSVPFEEVVQRDDLNSCLDSGLVLQHGRHLRFALPILGQWFAAEALAHGEITADAILGDEERLDRWLSPLAVRVATASYEGASALLTPLAERHPAVAAQVLDLAVAERWHPSRPARENLPSTLECARRLRDVMDAWVTGLGDLGRYLGPFDQTGRPKSVWVRKHDNVLSVGWSSISAPDRIGEMPVGEGWRSAYHDGGGRTSQVTENQEAWPWRWAFERLNGNLCDHLKRRQLPVPFGPLWHEHVWVVAMNWRAFEWRLCEVPGVTPFPGPPPASFSLDWLEALMRGAGDAQTVEVEKARYRPTEVLAYCAHLRAQGLDVLPAPLPQADLSWEDLLQKSTHLWVWSDYSQQALLAYAQRLFEGAVTAYQVLVQTWFPGMASRLGLSVILPAQIIVHVIPPEESEPGVGPILSWYPKALAKDQNTVVDIRLGRDPDESPEHYERLYHRLVTLRPAGAAWLSVPSQYLSMPLTDRRPITQLAYDWLYDDLRRIGWAERLSGLDDGIMSTLRRPVLDAVPNPTNFNNTKK